jgi:hypothetical protein
MLVRPQPDVSITFTRATASCAWCIAVRTLRACACSSAACMMAGGAPRNLMPSAPAPAIASTQRRA